MVKYPLVISSPIIGNDPSGKESAKKANEGSSDPKDKLKMQT
jgi:hypothetical protein